MRHHRRVRIRVLAAATLVAGAVAAAWWWSSDGGDGSGADGSFVAVQMNLCGALGCYGEDVPDRMEVVGFATARITEARADVVLLNEVCFDQVDAIVVELGPSWAMSAVTVETLATGNGCAGAGYGNAVLHRGTLLEERIFGSCELGAPPCLENPPLSLSSEQRAMVCARVRPQETGGEDVTACSVHLVPRGRQRLGERTWDEWHDIQLDSLQALAGSELDAGGAVIVGGDLNVGPRRALAGWPAGWTEIDDRLQPTRPVPDPRRKIDYVLLSTELRATGSELLPVDRCPSSRAAGGWCTDHVPLAGTVSFTRTRAQRSGPGPRGRRR